MTTKLKKAIVALSRNKRVEKVLNIYFWVLVVIIIASYFFEEIETLACFIALTGLILALPYIALRAIKEQNDEVIESNKLMVIVFSNKNALEHYILFIFAFPVCCVLSYFINFNFITVFLYIVIVIISTIKLSEIISNYFKKKLSE